MTPGDRDDMSDVTAVVSEVLADPAAGRSRLPQLLGLLDADDPNRRLSAAWCLCLVASDCPDTVEPLVWRLVDRLAEKAENLETRHALAYIRQRYPDRTDETLSEIAAATAERETRTRHIEISHGFARSNYYGQSDINRDVGQTQLPVDETDGGPGQIYQKEIDEGTEQEPQTQDTRESQADTGDESGRDSDESDESESENESQPKAASAENEAEAEDETPTTGSDAARRRKQKKALEQIATDIDLADIAAASQFGDLALTASPVDGRYTDVYRMRAEQENTEQGVALRTFDLPEDDEEAFITDITEQLRNWQAIADHDFVATLYDWNSDPSLWMATEYATETLYDRGDLSFEDAVWSGRQIVETVAVAHEQGIVHGGLDPYNVVYAGTTISGRPKPLVTNFGLFSVLRMYFEPADYIDPRYSAPEYFTTKYGDVDHATDIYHLGAVLYRLVTGQPPYDGTYSEIRQRILSAQPPAPSSIEPDIPDWIDDVVHKAMAKQKITRYESAAHLVQELSRQLDGDL